MSGSDVAGSTASGAATGASVGGGYGALIGAGLGLAQGVMGANAASKAAKAQEDAANRALVLNEQRYGESQGNFDPYIRTGQAALDKYAGMLDTKQPEYTYTQPEFNFNTHSDPGAQYRMAQASKAIQNSALARGMTGGGAITSLAEKNQEMAGQAYADAFGRYKDMSTINSTLANNKYARDTGWLNNIMDRYSNIATGGQNAAAQLASTGTGNAAAMSNLYTNLGDAAAQGIVGGQSALNTGISQLAQGIGQYYGGGSGNGQTNYNFGGTK